MAGAPRLVRALPALLVWAAGCEVLVSGQLVDVHCQDEGAVGPPACPDGYVCAAGLCVQSALGIPCTTDSDCAAGDLCLDPLLWSTPSLGLPDAGPSPVDGGPLDAATDAGAAAGDAGILAQIAVAKLCSRVCCTSSDCDAQFVCVPAPAVGSGFCRAAADVDRVPGGTREAMAACSSAADCRSGLCLDNLCADTCCTDTSCALGALGALDAGACRFTAPLGEPEGFWCGAPVAKTVPSYTQCKSQTDCPSGVCGPLPLFEDSLYCLPPCCDSSDCDSFKGYEVQCVPFAQAGVPGRVRVCAGMSGGMAGAGADNGVACSADADCRGGLCVGDAGHGECTDTCCSDESCGNQAAFACRLATSDGGWALRCEPK